MQEKKTAKAAAKKEQLEKAKLARAASMAAKAAARAAEAEAAAQHAASAYGHLSSDDDFLGPLQGRSQQPFQPEQSRQGSADAAGPSRTLNGFAQHAQRGQLASAPADSDGAKQPASRNGYHLHHSLAQHSHCMGHGNGALPAESGAQDSEAHVRFPPEHRRMSHLGRDQPLKEEDSWDGAHAQLLHSGGERQLLSELSACELESKQPDCEEADKGADDKFDWGAWMSPEGERKAIAERLQRPRRPPKRPYPLLDPPKPKPKKHQSLKGSSQHRDARLQHRLPDRLLMQESGSTSSGQLSHGWPHAHGPVQQAPKHRPGSAIPGRTAASQRAAKAKSKGRRALEKMGCIRAAAYQGEAFMQARVDVLHQQGVVPGNQAPADADHGHQVCYTPAPTPLSPPAPQHLLATVLFPSPSHLPFVLAQGHQGTLRLFDELWRASESLLSFCRSLKGCSADLPAVKAAHGVLIVPELTAGL